LQRRFLINETLFQSGDICNKVAKCILENYKFFGSEILGENDPKLDAQNVFKV